MHVPFAGTGSASAFPAPSVGIFSGLASRRRPAGISRRPAGTFSAPRRHLSGTVSGSFRRHFPGTAPAFFPPLRRYSAGAFRRHLLGLGVPPTPRRHFPAPRRRPAVTSSPASFPTLRRYPADATGVFRRLHLGLGAPQAPSSPNLPSRLLRHRRHPAEAPSRSGRTDLGSAAEGPRNQLQKRLSCSGSITSSTSPLARSISKSTPPPPVLGRPVVEISPPRGSAARRLPV